MWVTPVQWMEAVISKATVATHLHIQQRVWFMCAWYGHLFWTHKKQNVIKECLLVWIIIFNSTGYSSDAHALETSPGLTAFFLLCVNFYLQKLHHNKSSIISKNPHSGENQLTCPSYQQPGLKHAVRAEQWRLRSKECTSNYLRFLQATYNNQEVSAIPTQQLRGERRSE